MIIGVTGLSGAGKTTISQMFVDYGYLVLNADKIAKDVINKDEECKDKIRNAFGNDTILKNGNINRPVLSEYAFKNRNTLYKLSKMTHPYVMKEIQNRVKKFKNEGQNAIMDVVALFECGADRLCNYTILVTAPKSVRLNRIIKRDNISVKDALKRINAQIPESFYKNKANYTLECTKDRHLVKKEIEGLLKSIGGI